MSTKRMISNSKAYFLQRASAPELRIWPWPVALCSSSKRKIDASISLCGRLLIAGNSKSFVLELKSALCARFEIKDCAEADRFLGNQYSRYSLSYTLISLKAATAKIFSHVLAWRLVVQLQHKWLNNLTSLLVKQMHSTAVLPDERSEI